MTKLDADTDFYYPEVVRNYIHVYKATWSRLAVGQLEIKASKHKHAHTYLLPEEWIFFLQLFGQVLSLQPVLHPGLLHPRVQGSQACGSHGILGGRKSKRRSEHESRDTAT